MAVAFFPDMNGQGVEAGWTPRNLGLKARGHDVGVNDWDVVIHFESCAKCEQGRELMETARDILAFADVIEGATDEERELFGIPSLESLAWARKLVGGEA